jgi:hypothetical protein
MWLPKVILATFARIQPSRHWGGMMTTAAATPSKVSGGTFLIEDFSPEEVFTAEDLSQEHRAIARTVDEFWANDVEPHLVAIHQQQPGVALNVLRKSANLGLTAGTCFGACLKGDALRRNMSVLGTLARFDPADATRRRNIASRLLANERYVWD